MEAFVENDIKSTCHVSGVIQLTYSIYLRVFRTENNKLSLQSLSFWDRRTTLFELATA